MSEQTPEVQLTGDIDAPEPAAAGREVELKLFTDPDTLQRLLVAAVITRNATSKGVVRRLEATYYDTPDAVIARQGASLRVRRSGKQFVQTLKLASEGSPLQRREMEARVPDSALQLDALPLAELGAPFATLPGAELVPVFTTKIRRHTKVVAFGGAVIEVAFDEGTLSAGEKVEAVCEIELELKAGGAGTLYELALSLLEQGAVRIGFQSKAERGYALAFGTAPRAEKAFATGIAPADTTDDVIAKVLSACQWHVMANLMAAHHGQDPEGVHQLRVALRRLRTALSLFRKEVPASALQALGLDAKRLASALGPARNWDVFATSTIAEIERANLPGVDFTALRSATAAPRARSYQAVRVDLIDLECTRFLLSLGRVIERRSWRNDIGVEALAVLTQPARDFAGRGLTRLHRKALKQGHNFRKLRPTARHELRLTLKKLRYGSEFLLPLYDHDGAARKYLKRMSRLQDILGIDNDITTTQSLLREVEESTSLPQVHKAIGAITGWQGRDRIETAEALRRSWRKFIDAEPFWHG
ncbi:CYTH and CHAD domain-containing protein [Ancylobacter rudongensis]|uniref:Inorganic triphosphatase YgiF, contains CYTH and CHAD domains n=1 Tax=Ancylobacter rudongensis TaxID=177413 RepID=A0A1G4SFR2_9HYPH|nr:CYTH and CHAD domain-containing protein [Ancylobacter rudongensis]SCW67169.1 Inorganic triphosphatase YgiF, contains CYTH and CHAD domains [Ancylobacter rudongensis]